MPFLLENNLENTVDKIKAFYFSPPNGKLAHGDNRTIEVGKTHTVDCIPKVCEQGLHASVRPVDALKYAKSDNLYIVEVSGLIDVGEDKIAGTSRTYLSKIPNSTELLREFARASALWSVNRYYPDIPEVVTKWLETGDESLRLAAGSAADLAADSATDSAAYSAAYLAADLAAYLAAGSAADLAAYSKLNEIFLKLIGKYNK